MTLEELDCRLGLKPQRFKPRLQSKADPTMTRPRCCVVGPRRRGNALGLRSLSASAERSSRRSRRSIAVRHRTDRCHSIRAHQITWWTGHRPRIFGFRYARGRLGVATSRREGNCDSSAARYSLPPSADCSWAGSRRLLRRRLERVAAAVGVGTHRGSPGSILVGGAHPSQRSQRVVRASRSGFDGPAAEGISETAPPLPEYDVVHRRPADPAEDTAERVARRVDAQFEQGLLDEMRGLLARGVPETALPFSGLVYRQALEHLHKVRDEPATRELIVRENRKYSRRQLIWFRKEPNLRWIYAAGERDSTRDDVARLL